MIDDEKARAPSRSVDREGITVNLARYVPNLLEIDFKSVGCRADVWKAEYLPCLSLLPNVSLPDTRCPPGSLNS